MKKYVILFLLLSCFFTVKNACAIFDAMANIETIMKNVDDMQNNVLNTEMFGEMSDISDAQGFVSKAMSCYSSPTNCISQAFMAALKNEKTKDIQDGVATPGAKNGDLTKKDPAKEGEEIRENATYKKGQGQDVQKRLEFKKQSNARVADNIAKLFAKGITTRQSILQEDASLYKTEYKNNNLEEVVFMQGAVSLNSQRRIARILELRSFMFYAPALKEMDQYNREANE